MVKKHIYDKIVKNIGIHNSPLIPGWHLHNKKEIKGSVYKNFGKNWWDLLSENKIGIKHKIEIKQNADIHTYVMINMGHKTLEVTDKLSQEVYNIPSGHRSYLNQYKNKYLLVTNDKNCLIQPVIIGEIVVVLFGIENTKKITNTALFNDFFLMCGIPNKHQYISTTDLNVWLEKYEIEHRNLEIEEEERSEWAEFLETHWIECNPSNAIILPKSKSIPFKIHWIWISRVPGTENPLKKRFTKFIKTWIVRNPNCEYNLWTDSSNPGVPIELKDKIRVRNIKDIQNILNSLPNSIKNGVKYVYKNHPNVGARSDTLRQSILYVEGGCYADVNDMNCLMPIEDLFEKFDYMIGLEPGIYVNNAFMASAPKHIIPKNFLTFISINSREFVKEWKDDSPDMSKDEKDDLIVSQTGPIAMTSVIFGVIDKDLSNTCIFPCSWIYPNYGVTKSSENWLKPVSLTAHFDARDYLK